MKHVRNVVRSTGFSAGYEDQLSGNDWKSFSKDLIRERGAHCENCRQGGKRLNCHHIAYGDKRPLREQKENFIVLCEPCHGEIHAELVNFRNQVFRHLNGQCFRILNGALAVGLTKSNPLELVHAIAEMAASPGSVKRFAYAWNDGKQP